MQGNMDWSCRLEELIDDGNTDAAIAYMHDVISALENTPNSDSNLTLAAALNDLGRLYSMAGYSIKADSCFERSLLIKNRVHQVCTPWSSSEEKKDPPPEENGNMFVSCSTTPEPVASCSEEDDWEAVADQIPDLPIQKTVTAELSRLSLKSEAQISNQRGRGAFRYGENGLYSDQKDRITCSNKTTEDCIADDIVQQPAEEKMKYGTGHVLVVEGFPPDTSTLDLEKPFEAFKRDGVVVRRINDTLALAVFSKPSSARKGLCSMQSCYSIRQLDENDTIFSTLSKKDFCFADLEPPLHRPRTSAQTANRLIFGALRSQGLTPNNSKVRPAFRDIKKQEEERRDRILTRQRLRDEAWGLDD